MGERYIGDVRMSFSAWHKVLYVAVHIGYVDMYFDFRSFDCHYEVHRKYLIMSDGMQRINFYSMCTGFPRSSLFTD